MISNLSTIAGDTTSLDTKITTCDTGAVVVASGAITETNSGAIATSVGKITQGYDATISSGGSGLQQAVVYGRDAGGDLDALNVDTQGHLKITIQGEEKDTNGGAATSWSSTTILDGASANTTGIDIQNDKTLAVYGTSTNTLDAINLQVSVDNTNWFTESSNYIYPSANGDIGYIFPNEIPFRYVRFNKENTSGSSETITLNYIIMKF